MRGLDRRIDIERKTTSPDATGQPVETWAKLCSRRPAAVVPVGGDERFSAEQFIGKQQVEFRIRWSSVVADLSVLDRIVYPASGDSPEVEQVFDIIDVAELGRRDGLRIIATRRSENV